MSIRVFLINPPSDSAFGEHERPDYAHLGLACIAGELRKARTGPISITDAKLEGINHNEIRRRIRAYKPDIVGITATTCDFLSAIRTADLIKRISPSIITVAGGPHVTALPESSLRMHPEIDYVVTGEGETAFRELVESLAGGKSPSGVSGIVYRNEGFITETAKREPVNNLDILADPARDLMPAGQKHLVSTQRGCPFSCNFCFNPNGRRIRQRSIDRVIGEMERIAGENGGEIIFCDEIFSFDEERTHLLLDALISSGLSEKIGWSAATHAAFLNRNLMRKMKAAGCRLCEIGVESGDSAILASMQKNLSTDLIRETRKNAAETALPVGILMILGHPGESLQSARKTVNFAVELNADRTVFGIMTPYPGTRIAEMAHKGEAGYRLITHNWNDYGKQLGNALELEKLSRRQLELLQLTAYVKVLVCNKRYADFAAFAWKHRQEGFRVLKKIMRPVF